MTEVRWIDNDVLLERTSTIRTLDQNLQDLSRRSLFNSDQQRILETIHAVSAQLLRPSEQETLASAQRSSRDAQRDDKLEDDDTPVALDPAAMVRSLNDLKRERHERFGGRFFPYAGTLEGVMGMLFAQEDQQEDIDLGRETWTADEPEEIVDENGSMQGQKSVPQNPVRLSEQAASLETLLSFKEQLRTFLDELAKPSFAETCEVSRMVQALAFPLLLCLRGSEAGWLSANELASVATRVAWIMLNRPYGAGKPRGILRMVQQRYSAAGRLNELQSAVGSGALWTVLLAALAPDASAPLRVLIPQAAALSAVFQCQDLLTHTDASHLSGLVQSVLIKNAEVNITEKAGKISEAMSSLTKALSAQWDVLYQEQGSGRHLQPAGSLLWSARWGWEVPSSPPAQTYRSGYIHLEMAAAAYAGIQKALAGVIDACTNSGRAPD